MGSRIELQSLFEEILETKNVYFQPPESIKIKYPCIIYHLANEDKLYADNNPYSRTKMYTVTVIDKNPDSLIPDKIGDLPMSSFDRFFTSNNLNHFVYRLYF